MKVSDMKKNPPKAELAVVEVEAIIQDLLITTDEGYEVAAKVLLERIKPLQKKLTVAEKLLKGKMIGYQHKAEEVDEVGMPELGQLPVPVPAGGAPRVKGISTSKKWVIEVLDMDEFCLWLLSTRPGMGYVAYVPKKVDAMLKRLGGQVDWPGVVISEKRTVRVRSEDGK